MLIDSGFKSDLENAPQNSGQQTLTFVNKVLKGLLYADLSVAGRVITGQLKKGDGTNHTAQVDLAITSIAPLAVSPAPQVEGVITVNTGTSSASSVLSTHVKTTSGGAFQVTIGGTGSVAVHVQVHLGLPSVVLVS